MVFVPCVHSADEYRAAQAEHMVKCPYCKKTFKSDQKLAFHNRWFCGPNARRCVVRHESDPRTQRLL